MVRYYTILEEYVREEHEDYYEAVIDYFDGVNILGWSYVVSGYVPITKSEVSSGNFEKRIDEIVSNIDKIQLLVRYCLDEKITPRNIRYIPDFLSDVWYEEADNYWNGFDGYKKLG